MRHPSSDLKRAAFRALLVTRRNCGSVVTLDAVVASLLRAPDVTALCTREAPDEELGRISGEHIAMTEPLPMEPAVSAAMQTVFDEPCDRSVTPAELLLALASANPGVADRLAHYGLTIDLMRSALPA